MLKNLVCGVLTLIAAGIYITAANQLPVSLLSDGVGASGFPLLIGWTLLCLSVLLIAQTLISTRVAAPPATDVQPDETGLDDVWAHPKRTLTGAVVLMIIAASFVIALPVLGYLISIAFLIAATAAYISKAASRQIVVVALGGAVFLYVLFVLFLGIAMPAGLLEGVMP